MDNPALASHGSTGSQLPLFKKNPSSIAMHQGKPACLTLQWVRLLASVRAPVNLWASLTRWTYELNELSKSYWRTCGSCYTESSVFINSLVQSLESTGSQVSLAK